MSNSPNNRDRQSGGDGFFPRTRWSIILEAKGEGEEAEGAFAELMKLYRKPIYASFYHHCKNEEDAKDLTQSFILGLLRRDDIKKIDPEKGRFRSFLRAAIKVAAIAVGFFIVMLFLLEYGDFVSVNWQAIDSSWSDFWSSVGDEWGDFQTFLTGRLPSAALAGVGLYVGLGIKRAR